MVALFSPVDVAPARTRRLARLALWCGACACADLAGAEASLIPLREAGWPQLRGPRRDGVSEERGLLPRWPEGGPAVQWTAAGAGRGFSSPIIGGGRIYVTGDVGEVVQLRAFTLEGKPLWTARNGSAWLNQYQGARASVTYSAGRIYHQNAQGRLACFDAATGREQWAVELLGRFGGENITWGLSECVLVDDQAVYATAGSRDALVVAFDKVTGALRWKSEPLVDPETKVVENPGYAPPILVQFAGRRLMVGCSQRHLFCVDVDTGKLQWTRRRPTSYSVLAMTPALVGDGVFMTAPYGPPGALHRLIAPASAEAKVGVEDTWTTTLDTAQGSVVHAKGRIYGSFYPRRGGWAALDAATGAVVLEAPDLVKGCAVYADGRLYALSEDGWMRLLRDAGREFAIEGQFRLATTRDRDAWAHPVIHDGRLYLRYHDTVTCYDIRATGAASP